MALELDKIRTDFDDIWDAARAAKPVRPKKPGLLRRMFGKRTYAYLTAQGEVFENKHHGLGFDRGDQTLFVEALRRPRPPVDEEAIIVTGWISRSFGREVRPRPVLLGFVTERGGVVYCRGNWATLHGRPMLKWLILLPVFALSLHYIGIGFDQPNMLLLIGGSGFALFYLLWAPVKLWQVAIARYDFRAQVSQLHHYLGE